MPGEDTSGHRPHNPGHRCPWSLSALDAASRHRAQIQVITSQLYSRIPQAPSSGSVTGPGHSPQGMVLGSPPGPDKGFPCPLLPDSFIWGFPQTPPPQRGPHSRARAPARSCPWGPTIPSVHKLVPAPPQGPRASCVGPSDPGLLVQGLNPEALALQIFGLPGAPTETPAAMGMGSRAPYPRGVTG